MAADAQYQTFDLGTARTKEPVHIPTSYFRIMEATGTAYFLFAPGAPVGELLLAEKTGCTVDGTPIGTVYLTNEAQPSETLVIMYSNNLRIGF